METGMEEFLQKKEDILGNGGQQILIFSSTLICISSDVIHLHKARHAYYRNRIRLLGARSKVQFSGHRIESETTSAGAVHSTHSTVN